MSSVVRFEFSTCYVVQFNCSVELFGLQGPEAYAYTSLSNCLEVSDIDDVKDYHDTIVSWFF